MCFSPQRRAIFRHQNFQKCSRNAVFCTFSLPNVRFATAACIFSSSGRTKVLSECGVLYIFTSECAFHHSGVQFFNISTYKSALGMRCFVHFHFRMSVSPQPRAFFHHQDVQKWAKHVMFCTFSLPNVLFATAACNFSTLARTKVVQTPHVLCIFTSECAFRHSGVQHSHVQKWSKHLMFCTFSLQNVLFATAACNFWFILSAPDLRTRRFNRPTFRLTRHTNHWKNTAFRDFSNI